jgi:hypothetical protein
LLAAGDTAEPAAAARVMPLPEPFEPLVSSCAGNLRDTAPGGCVTNESGSTLEATYAWRKSRGPVGLYSWQRLRLVPTGERERGYS